MPPPKRVRRFDSVPPRPSGPTICPVCREDLGSLQALHSHYLSCHAVRDNRLTTRPSFQCSRCSGIFGSAGGLHRHVCSSGDKLLEARQVGAVAATVGRPPPVHWIIATDGSAAPSSVEAPASAGWAFVVHREGLLEGPEVECWGEVLVDDKDPRALGAESLTNNAAELWALAEAFLWLRDESGDNKSIPVTLVYDSEVAKGLTTEPWAPMAHSTLVGLLRDLYVEASDSRSITWIHVRSHGREQDPSKQHLLPLNERADRLAERVDRETLVLILGDGYTPLALTSQSWQWNVVGGAVEFLFHLGLLAFTRLDVDLGRVLGQPLSAGNVGGSSHNILGERNVLHMNSIVWVRLLQT